MINVRATVEGWTPKRWARSTSFRPRRKRICKEQNESNYQVDHSVRLTYIIYQQGKKEITKKKKKKKKKKKEKIERCTLLWMFWRPMHKCMSNQKNWEKQGNLTRMPLHLIDCTFSERKKKNKNNKIKKRWKKHVKVLRGFTKTIHQYYTLTITRRNWSTSESFEWRPGFNPSRSLSSSVVSVPFQVRITCKEHTMKKASSNWERERKASRKIWYC